MLYSVIRTYSRAEYCEVEAESEQEAIEIAKDYGEWDENPNDEYIDPYEYIAEPVN